MAKRRRAALYLRVSRGNRQDPQNQRPELDRLARQRRLRVVAVYEERASAAAVKRPQLEQMLDDAHAGAFDVLLVWSLDRLGRSMGGNVRTLLELDRRGVEVVSVREPWLDTGGPVRDLLVAVFGWIAEQERAQIVARTKAGLARARRKGVRLGRPEVQVDIKRARALRAEGLSYRAVAEQLGLASHMTVIRALARDEEAQGAKKPRHKKGAKKSARKSAKSRKR